MSVPPLDDPWKDFLDDVGVLSPTPSLEAFLEQSNLDDNFLNNSDPAELLPDSNNSTSMGLSSGFQASQDLSAFSLQSASVSPDSQPIASQPLIIIAQSHCATKTRYRKDYLPPSKRRDPLTNKNPTSSYTGPAVTIAPEYLDPAVYSIGVSLATPMHEKTNCCYIHPYELESIDNSSRNDQDNNIVWYSIEQEDLLGSKSFPDLRIVRKKESELESAGALRPFYDANTNLLTNNAQRPGSTRKMVAEYNLKKAHLAFFIGQQSHENHSFPMVIIPDSVIFSDEMVLIPDGTTGDDDQSVASIEKSTASSLSDCRVYKYAPRYGFTEGGEEMLIFLTKKAEERKHGKLQITFQCTTLSHQSPIIVNPDTIEVKDQMVSFQIPTFPFPVDHLISVKVTLQQRERTLGSFDYSYIPKSQCITCQANTMNIPNPFARSYSNKRTKSSLNTTDEESDAVVPLIKITPVLQQTRSEPGPTSSNATTERSTDANQARPLEEEIDRLLNDLHHSIESLFLHNDYKPLLRNCRMGIRKRPELLHEAISKDYSDLVSTFIPVAGINLMQHKNELGETVLLHAARLDRLHIVKAVLERKESDTLLEETNNKEQNIFHLLTLNTDSDELLDLIITHLLEKSVDIAAKFDHSDAAGHTPLQLAVLKNNIPATGHLLKYFNKHIRVTLKNNNENLIHLAVRHCDLPMLKYLLNEGQLIEQGKETSLTMTPMELARSINRNDMVEYLKEIYPQPEIEDDESSDED